jgi:hypothetical protein
MAISVDRRALEPDGVIVIPVSTLVLHSGEFVGSAMRRRGGRRPRRRQETRYRGIGVGWRSHSRSGWHIQRHQGFAPERFCTGRYSRAWGLQ